MNREIKFRAWLKDTKEMIEVEDIQFYRKDTIKIDWIKLEPKPKEEQELIINTNSAWRSENEIELMQYTGLKDVNEKEIYEWDIIWWEYFCENDKIKEYSIVTFYWWCFCCNDYNRPDFVWREVIWNIYENPDLINN